MFMPDCPSVWLYERHCEEPGHSFKMLEGRLLIGYHMALIPWSISVLCVSSRWLWVWWVILIWTTPLLPPECDFVRANLHIAYDWLFILYTLMSECDFVRSDLRPANSLVCDWLFVLYTLMIDSDLIRTDLRPRCTSGWWLAACWCASWCVWTGGHSSWSAWSIPCTGSASHLQNNR